MPGMVTVTGRDELGRIIDVQVTTTADVPPPGPETVSSSSGVQTVRLLGPYRINHDTEGTSPDAEGSFAESWSVSVGDVLPEGSTILQAWPDIVTAFDGGADSIGVGVGADGDPDNTLILVGTWLSTTQAAGDDATVTTQLAAYTPGGVVRVVGPAARLAAVLNQSGAVDIYALVAEPA